MAPFNSHGIRTLRETMGVCVGAPSGSLVTGAFDPTSEWLGSIASVTTAPAWSSDPRLVRPNGLTVFHVEHGVPWLETAAKDGASIVPRGTYPSKLAQIGLISDIAPKWNASKRPGKMSLA